MKTVIIANPSAASGRVGRRWREYNRAVVAAFGPCQVRMTQRPGDAMNLARQARNSGFERIVVVGGDGTLNEVVNGLFSDGAGPLGPQVSVALYPAGTGGDFARSIAMNVKEPEAYLRSATEHRVDIGRAQLTAPDGASICKHFINISSFGASGLIVDRVNNTSKMWGGKAAFFLGTVRGLADYQNQRVRLRVDDRFDEEILFNTIAVANGRYFGGSMKIAPHAYVDDGQFDVTIMGNLGMMAFLRYSSAIYKGEHLGRPEVRSVRGRVVTAQPLGDTPVLIDLDGEQPGMLPARYEVLPRALKVLAPWGRAEAAQPGSVTPLGQDGAGGS